MNTMVNCSANVMVAIGFGHGPLGWKNVNPLPAWVSIEVIPIIIAKFVTSAGHNFGIKTIHTLGRVVALHLDLDSSFVTSLIPTVTQGHILGPDRLFMILL